MAERYAVADGNWSSVATWDGGASKPSSGDTVHAGGYTVTVDEDVTVVKLTTAAGASAPAGGVFDLPAGVTLNADIEAGTTTCCTDSGSGTVTINGDVTGGPSTDAYGVSHTGSGTLNVTGNISAQDASVSGIYGISSTGGAVNVVGNVNASPRGGGAGPGFRNGIRASSTTLSVTGDVTGGGSSAGIYMDGTSTASITGTVTAGITASGVQNQGSGACIITGSLVATTTTHAVTGTGAGLYIFNADWTSASNGKAAVYASNPFVISDSLEMTHTYRENNGGAPGDARSLYTGGTDIGNPSSTDVRSGTAFGPSSEYTGSLEVPDAQYVNAGVLVDSGVGTLAALDASGVRAAIGLSSANLDTQLSSINSAVANGVIATGVSSGVVTDIWSTYALPESYAASGAEPTPAQMMYLTQQAFTDFSISGTTITVNQIDGTGIAATYTMDDPQTPTSRTRST